MKKILLDTNSLLRLLLNDIPPQKKIVEELLHKAKSKEIYIRIPEIVVFEIEFALNKYYSVPKDEVIEKLQIIMTLNFIEIESKHVFTTALEIYSNQSISFVDCFIRAKSSIENYELFTFDKKLLRASL